MGRARRDQRDAIRKQRAAKRRKRGNDESDEDDVNTEDGIIVLAKRLKSEDRKLVISHDVAVAATSVNTASSVQLNLSEEIPASSSPVHGPDQNKIEGTNPSAGTCCTQDSMKQTLSKPLDKIERMRLKKQQQKARRREKKAAKNGVNS